MDAGFAEDVAKLIPAPRAGPPGRPGVVDYSKIPPLPVRQLFMKRGDSGAWSVEKEQSDQVYFAKGEGLTIRIYPPE